MARLRCKKCGNIFEYNHQPFDSLVHLGTFKMLKCPACGKSSFFNWLFSVKDPVTWPPQEKKAEQPETQRSEEDLEKKRIEESKYEKP